MIGSICAKIINFLSPLQGVVLLMVVLATCTSANKNDTDVVQEAIDQNYLESDSYQLFAKQSRLERKRSLRQKKNFTKFVQQQLPDFEGITLELPAVIDTKMMQSSYGDKPAQRSSLITLFGLQQIYDPLAKIEANNKQYHLFATCKVASYKKCLIWLASGKNGRLIQLEMLTTYIKSPVYSEIPVITITKDGVSIKVNRKVLYALGLVDKYTIQYALTDDGRIFRK